MNRAATDYIYILLTILFTVYGQLIIKWRMRGVTLPVEMTEKVKALIVLMFDPYVFSGYVTALLASFAWMAAMTKFPLSYAYPFMSLNFVVVLALSALLLAEPLSLARCAGVALIILGTVIAARG